MFSVTTHHLHTVRQCQQQPSPPKVLYKLMYSALENNVVTYPNMSRPLTSMLESVRCYLWPISEGEEALPSDPSNTNM